MAPLGNGTANGQASGPPTSKRFSDIPSAIEIPVGNDEDDEAVELNAEELGEDPREVCQLLEQEKAARTYWMTVALAYAKQRKMDHAIDVLTRGNNAIQTNDARDKLGMICCLCWMYLWKSREAPRVAPEGALVSEAKTKEYYLQLATSTFNEATRITAMFPPLFLARGVLLLLRASLQAPSKTPTSGLLDPERADLLRAALKSFEDAIRVSQGKNMLAVLGKARALYSLGKYSEALAYYQEVLQKMPDMIDPDPRIGIGCCFWQLGFKDDARQAWERCLELNPLSKVANSLMGLYYLDASSHVAINSPEFIQLYKKAMTDYMQKAFKLNKDFPLASVNLASHLVSRKSNANVDPVVQRAIQYTDVNAIASDGWYLLARKEHYDGNIEKASHHYRRADDARGGMERGYLPAKFGLAQLSVLRNDLGEAKLLLEKMVQQSKNHEAMSLLGTLYAEEVFASQYSDSKEDKSAELKKAINLLENAKNAWKDPKKSFPPDPSLLLNLARLYETESPDKALQCLQQVEQLELDRVPKSELPLDMDNPAGIKAELRKFLPPQLLNNIGCFHYQAGKHEFASEMFEAALSACMKIGEQNQSADTGALVTTISYNLGRSYESTGLPDLAAEVYEQLLAKHHDYTDARTRLAYIKLRKSPNSDGPDTVAKLYQDNSGDLEVRALFGWFLGKVNAKKRVANVLEDVEFRHYKHTLQNHDKHDRYALVGMGNLHLMYAREMRRETDQDKAKRSASYSKAVEFFEKALSLDPKNAYAAQGIAIALVEDKRDNKAALPIFLKVRDTVKDPHVYVNLGHIFTDLKQHTKSIECYETALSREGKAHDSLILACLGRAWLNKGRSEKDLDAYIRALECAQKAFVGAPDQVHYKFNIAFVQIQLATTIIAASETQKTLIQLESAADGLEMAITALEEIAVHPQAPYPKQDIEQRANMARNTLRKQLERATAQQREYEEKNKEKLQAAMEQRQAELQRREAVRQEVLEKEKVRQEKIRKEREEIVARDRALATQREEVDRARADAELTTDAETGEKVKRKRKAATSRTAGDGPGSGPRRSGGSRKKAEKSDGESQADRPRPKKKRKVGIKDSGKYKSAEIVVDSDDEDDDDDDKADEHEEDLDGEEGPRNRAVRQVGRRWSPASSASSGGAAARRRRRRSRSRSSSRSRSRSRSGDMADEGMDLDEDEDGGAAVVEGRGEASSEEEGVQDDGGVIRRRQQTQRPRRGRIMAESDDEDDEDRRPLSEAESPLAGVLEPGYDQEQEQEQEWEREPERERGRSRSRTPAGSEDLSPPPESGGADLDMADVDLEEDE